MPPAQSQNPPENPLAPEIQTFLSTLPDISVTTEKIENSTRTIYSTPPIEHRNDTDEGYSAPPNNSAASTPSKSGSSSRPFLILHKNTLELRTDPKLSSLLQSKYESVMRSRYFGKGGLEIVLSGQLSTSDLIDLIRLSHQLSQN